MNNVTAYKPLKNDLDNFAKDEAEALGLPYEMVRSAVYNPDLNGNPVFYGAGYLDILKIVALELGLGVMKFGKFKFKLLNTSYVFDNQEKWRAIINSKFVEEEVGGVLTARLCKSVSDQGQAMVKAMDSFHSLTVEQIIPTPKTADQLAQFAEENHTIIVPKDLPLLQSCHVDWEIMQNREVLEVGETSYFVDYTKTKLGIKGQKGERKGASAYLPCTMVTRTKIAAHQYAFGQSSSYLLKLRKFKNCELQEEIFEDYTIFDDKSQKNKANDEFMEKKRVMLTASTEPTTNLKALSKIDDEIET